MLCFVVFVMAKSNDKNVSTFSIQVPADQDEFLQQAAELLCNSKVGVIKLAINRLKNSDFLAEAQRLASTDSTEGTSREAVLAA